jgi:hypothetical protein
MDDDELSVRCVACHSLMLVGTSIQEGGGPTLEEMRCQLVSHTILEGQTEVTSLKIKDLYDAYVMRKHNKLYCDETVQFPKEPSEILDHGKLEMIHTFEFQEGGQLLHAENITDKHQQDILLLLSQYGMYSGKAASHNPARTLRPSHDIQDIISSLQDGVQHHNQLVALVDLW